MIRPIPNPPMGQEDILRFRINLEKHLRGNFSTLERELMATQEVRATKNVQRIIANCGGKNPLLGY